MNIVTSVDGLSSVLVCAMFITGTQCSYYCEHWRSKDGAEHAAAVVAAALHGGADPGRHGDGEAGGVPRRRGPGRGVGQRAGRGVLQGPQSV